MEGLPSQGAEPQGLRRPESPRHPNGSINVSWCPPGMKPITRKHNENLHPVAIVQGEYSKRASYEFVYDSRAYRAINAASQPSARRAATRRSAADRSSSPPTHTRYRGGPPDAIITPVEPW